MGSKYRYPGSRPFETADKNLFFGREDDIERLSNSIKVEDFLVIYGKSGLGKSSLLNAGVLPKLQQTGEYDVNVVRLGSFQKDQEDYQPPIIKLLRAIRMNRRKESFLRKVHRDSHSLWQSFKGIQIAEELDKEFVLVIDQFEELFTYPDRDIKIFKEQLAELQSGAVPQRFRQALKDKMAKDPEMLSKHEMNLLYKKMPVHIVLAIRSDKMSLLNRLSNHIPTVLQNMYEVRPLTREQAEDAILNPADIPNDFDEYASPPFDYSDEALDKILDYLTRHNEKDIESFQLQILCQYVEESIVIAEDDVSISADDLGSLEAVYQNYYDHQIQKLSTKTERDKARRLIEEGLIFEGEGEERRLSIYEGQILQDYKISRALLKELVGTHLLRAVPNPSGGFSYEISHDTLVAPILKSKEKRLEESRKAEREEKVKKEIRERNRVWITRAVIIVILLLLFMGVSWYTNLIDANRQLDIANQDLRDANNKLGAFSQTKIGAITAERDSLKEQYESLQKDCQDLREKQLAIIDSVLEGGDTNGTATDPVEWKAKVAIKDSKIRNLQKELQRLATHMNTRETSHRDAVQKLNIELKEAVDLILKQDEYLKFKNGVLKKYQDYEKTLREKVTISGSGSTFKTKAGGP